MLIRVRTNVGVWRIDDLDASSAHAKDVVEGIRTVRPNVVFEKPLSLDPGCGNPVDEGRSLQAQNLSHGAMIHCRVDPTSCVEASASGTTTADSEHKESSALASSSHVKRVIAKDGSIKLVREDSLQSANGFRKGMLSLRDMKMHWTLNEFMEMDDQFTFKIQRQKESWIEVKGGLSVERSAAMDFQQLMSSFDFKRQRFGFLYGTDATTSGNEGDDKHKSDLEKLDDNNNIDHDQRSKVKVECIYEPPQEVDPDCPDGFILLEDPKEERVENLAKLLGLKKVGWIYGHPPREKGFVMSAAELIMAAEFQLEAADGVKPTPFVTVKVTRDEQNNTSNFEAFQVSLQCMEMVSEEALQPHPTDPKISLVNETFTAVVEAKNTPTVTNDFFLTLVPIVQHVSDTFVYQFPKTNREDYGERPQSPEELKRQLSKSGSQGWDFIDLLSDFHLLLFLSGMLDEKNDVPTICASVANRDVPLPDGYKIIIAGMAGMDGAY